MINGKKTEVHLCDECAKKNKEINFNSPFSIHQFLAGLLEGTQEEPFELNYLNEIKCANCGMTFDRFKQIGKFGCPKCYHSFRDKSIPLIKGIHGHDRHIGKVPKRAGDNIRIKKDIERLKLKLDDAIEREAFEQAAEIRDKIKMLESQLEN
ncbi:UvrB/UvrC motif-containing protein [Clostridiisalibacter paucivorans]|uniref:UvrB/UvrC motif-containing protein n=1 Tax=Clostridiisalibacter paucivorans TaxID=408753 RepID=UPI003D64C397